MLIIDNSKVISCLLAQRTRVINIKSCVAYASKNILYKANVFILSERKTNWNFPSFFKSENKVLKFW